MKKLFISALLLLSSNSVYARSLQFESEICIERSSADLSEILELIHSSVQEEYRCGSKFPSHTLKPETKTFEVKYLGNGCPFGSRYHVKIEGECP